MIGDILNLIAKEVSTYIDTQTQISIGGHKSVVLQKPTNLKGELSIPDGTIALSLLNIEEESGIRDATVKKQVIDGKVFKQNPPINIHLYVIFIANFQNDYLNELNSITKIIEFFQKKPVFASSNTKDMGKIGVEKINFKLISTPLKEQHNLWSLLGTTYMPSLVYQVSMLSIQEAMVPIDTGIVERVDIHTQIKK
ncbi:MAG: DUF4255 domain-containing protein [Campylobacterales bacterium]|nr:DUF4255 domain-containing protein [Campylobacterales bacterium]